MNTLKRLISLIAFAATTGVATAQNYNNIEFVENKGQWDDQVKFKGEVNAGAIFIRSTGFTILQHNQQDYNAIQQIIHNHDSKDKIAAAAAKDSKGNAVIRSHAYNVDFVGASPAMQVIPDKSITAYNNYIIGNDSSKWASECRIFQAVTLKDVYPNVDVRYYTYNGTLKYDIIAKPGADISRIALKYTGANKISVKNKELVVGTSVGDLHESSPYTFQSDGKARTQVNCKYIVRDNIVTFDVKDYDRNSTLIIDPSLIFCSYSGSGSNNWGYTATYGPDGSFYGGGIVFAGNGYPASPGAFQTSYQGGSGTLAVDIGIIKLSRDGTSRVYATYIGGKTGNEQPHSLVVDPDGNLILAGRSNSSDYPLRGPALTQGGGYDIVVTKLNATGSAPLIGSVKVGGAGDDGVNIKEGRGGALSLEQSYGDDGRSEVIIDRTGNIYVASCTQSTDFPYTAGRFQPASGGKQDGMVLKFSPNLGSILFASYLGGSGNDAAYVLALGGNGNIYVAGGTERGAGANSATDLPGTHAGTVGPQSNGGIDGFVSQISNDGSTCIRTAYIGTSGTDEVFGIQFDKNGFPYITGTTTGVFPAFNAQYVNVNAKQFIAKLQPDLSAWVYKTTFGNASTAPNISITAFLVDRCENVYVSGWGGPINPGDPSEYPSAGVQGMPLTADALKSATNGQDFYFFVLRRDAAGTTPLFASYFGQNNGFPDHVDGGTSRFDQNGVIYQAVCACGDNNDFPTTPGVWGPTKPDGIYCNLGMIKIAFNLAGVGSDVQSSINGVTRDTAGCVPLDVTFTDVVRNAQQYIWNFGDGSGDFGPMDADTGYTRNHTFNAVGVYRVMLVAINPLSCNVRDTSYVNIRVGDLKANLAANYEKVGACTALSYRFHNLSTTDPSRPFTDTSFVWDFGDGSPRVVAGMNDVDHLFPAPGPYTVRLVVNDTSYCNSPDSLTLDLRISANVDALFITPATGCAPYSAFFNNTSVGGVSFEWDFGDPASGAANTSTDINPTHEFATPGTYNIVMVANDPFTCNKTDTARSTLIVYEKPTSNFSFTPVAPVENTPNIFTNLASPNATSFKWLFGDGDSLATTSRTDVSHQYNSTGTFNACLVAFNEAGCSDTFCLPVTTIVRPLLDVPNAFTPNSGDINSIVMVRGFGIAKMRFIIWNRWGQKVFETGNRLQGWDGRVKGALQPMDVYAYTLDVEFFDGTKATKKGDITLIR